MTLLEQVESLQREVSLRGERIEAIEEKRAKQSTQIIFLQSQHQQFAQQIDDLNQSHQNIEKDKSKLKQNNAQLEQSNQSLQDKVDSLKQSLAWYEKQLFGRRSERRLAQVTNNQMMLGEMLDPQEMLDPPVKETIKSYTRKKSKKKIAEASVMDKGLRFSKDVPIREIYIPNPEIEGLSEDEYEVISQKVTHRLAQKPGSYFIKRYVRDVIKLKKENKLICAPAPQGVLEKSYADVTVLAGILVDKFRYHLPLHRQYQRMSDSGIYLSRSNLSNWVHQTVDLFEMIYYAQLSSILQSKVLTMDETPVKAGRSNGKMKQCYYWPVYGDQKEICFVFANTRSARVIKDTLGDDYDGVLLTDGYSGYQKYVSGTDVEHALCWAHTRRKFYEGQDRHPDLCQQALDRIQELYGVEKKIREKGLEDQDKAIYRSEHSRPIVDGFFKWLKKNIADMALLSGHGFTKAAGYALKREAGLRVFLENPDLPIDTNHIEREIRPIALGRKNWMFCTTEVGGRCVGIAQSLIATCRLHDVDPFTYFVDVLQRIDTHKATLVHQLTPKLWKQNFADKPLTSDHHVNNAAV